MAYEGYLVYNGVEIANVARTVQVAHALGVHTVRVAPSRVNWIAPALGESGYADVTTAPWYDAGVPASAEFAGMLVLRVDGLDDSTQSATAVEYTTDGGYGGKGRSSTANLVFDARLIASTERGAEYGRRWIARVLARPESNPLCVGADLRYFRLSEGEGNEQVHRRDVRLSRGISVTGKARRSTSARWSITFTLLAADPFEYSDEVPRVSGLGGDSGVAGPGVLASGSNTGSYILCATASADPLYDPDFPALVTPPSVPDFYPQGWDLDEGRGYRRHWVRVSSIEPDGLLVIPIIRFTTVTEARMVRLCIWPGNAPLDSQCGPLFSAVLTYLPPDRTLYLDGESQAAYTRDGDDIRRADSLAYSDDAEPLEWPGLAGYSTLLVTLDTFVKDSGYEGDGNVRASLGLMVKSD